MDKKRYRILIIGVMVILVLDQITKYLIRENFQIGESIHIIDGFIDLTYLLNSGAAFSFMANVDSVWVGRFFISASFLAIILIFFIYKDLEEHEKFVSYALISIMGGAIGNLVDRIIYGKVTDFLDFYINGHHWPVFNIADSAITIGVTIIIIQWVSPILSRKKS